MTIDKVHNIILFLLDDDLNGKHTPEEIDNSLHLAQLDRFNSIRPQIGNDQAVYAQSTMLHEALLPFRKSKTFTEADTPNGVLIIKDSEHLLAVTRSLSSESTTMISPVPIVNDDELGYRLNSQIVGPTESKPVAHRLSKTMIQFYPQTPKAGKVFYLKTPCEPKYAYREQGRQIIFSPGMSQDLEWADTETVQIIKGALQYLGVNLDAQTVYQAMQNKKGETR